MNDDFDRLLQKHLADPAFKKAWEALTPELRMAQTIIDAGGSQPAPMELAQKPVLDQGQ